MSDMTLYDRDGRVVTQGALNQLMGQIDNYKACIERRKELQKDVADLNRLLRDVGWGQGEIDTAAVIAEENEQLRAALRKLVEAVGLLEGEEIAYGACKALNDAIAEAERLLGDQK